MSQAPRGGALMRQLKKLVIRRHRLAVQLQTLLSVALAGTALKPLSSAALLSQSRALLKKMAVVR